MLAYLIKFNQTRRNAQKKGLNRRENFVFNINLVNRTQSKQCKKTQQSVLHGREMEYDVKLLGTLLNWHLQKATLNKFNNFQCFPLDDVRSFDHQSLTHTHTRTVHMGL